MVHIGQVCAHIQMHIVRPKRDNYYIMPQHAEKDALKCDIPQNSCIVSMCLSPISDAITKYLKLDNFKRKEILAYGSEGS